MTKKTFKFALELVAGLIAGMIILAGFGVWRLSDGPVSLSYLTSIIEETINNEQDLVVINIEDTVLTWGGWERAIDVVARDVSVSQKNGTALAHFPEVSIGLSIRALTQGVVAPTSLEINAPELSVTKYEDGHIGIDFKPENSQQGFETQSGIRSVYDALLQKPGKGGVLGYLTRISIEDAKLTFENRVNNTIWHSQDASVIFERTKEQFTGNLKAQLDLEDKIVNFSIGAIHQYGDDRLYLLANLDALPPHMVLKFFPILDGYIDNINDISGNMEVAFDTAGVIRGAKIHAIGSYGALNAKLALGEAGENVELDVELLNFDVASLATGAEKLAQLKALEAKINAKIHAVGKITGEVDAMTVAVELEDGKIYLPNLYDEKLNIKSASLEFSAKDNFDQFDITKGRIDVGEGVITLGGQTRVEDDHRNVKLSATLVDFQMQNLHKYWPSSMGTDAWNWVIPNLAKGNVSEANINIFGKLANDGSNQFELVDMGGNIVGREMEVNYLAPMPIATGGVAIAEFGPGWLKVKIEEGAIQNVSLNSGYVEILNIGTTDDIAVKLDFSGPVDEMLVNLDREPLMFLDDLGFDREGTTGQANVKVDLKFQLMHSLTADQVAVKAEALMQNLFTPDAYDGQAGYADSLSLVVDNDGMEVKGKVLLAENLLDVKWRENFKATNEIKSQFVIAGNLDKKALEVFGYGPKEYAEGRFGLNLRLDEMRDGRKRINTLIDLSKSKLMMPMLNWIKEEGDYAHLSLKAEILNDGHVTISPLSLISNSLTLDGALNLQDHGDRFVDFTINSLSMGENSLKGTINQSDDGRYYVKVTGPRFDVSGLTGSNKDEEVVEVDVEEEPIDIDIDVSADFAVLTDGPLTQLNEVTFDLRYDNQAVQVFNLDSLAGRAPFTIRYNPDRFGGYDVEILSDNAGAVMAQLDVSGRIDGGKMIITGRREKAEAPIIGIASIKDFTLLEAPSIAKILEFMSLTGIVSALGQSGLPFSTLDAEFSYDDGVLNIKRGLAFGASIGITTEGKVDLDHREYALKGTVSPIYSLSRAISWIPVFGTLLSGDGGIFAARYTIGGSLDEPDVSVNPIAAITPGVLRNIFDVFGTDETLTRDHKIPENAPAKASPNSIVPPVK